MSRRWISLHCGEESDSLIRNHPNAFLLLTQIAMRAKWKDCSITKLKAGQSFVGDWKNAGLISEMAYRHAKKVLTECNLATFKGTNKGTVASLSSSMIFSYSTEPRNGPDNRPATDQQQTSNRPATTNHTDTLIHGYTDTNKEEPSFVNLLPQPLAVPDRTKKMTKPSLEEILEYGKTLDPPFKSAEKFIAFYDSKGWLIGKSPMKDWRATVRTWQLKDKTTTATKHRPIYEEFTYQKNGTSTHRPLYD